MACAFNALALEERVLSKAADMLVRVSRADTGRRCVLVGAGGLVQHHTRWITMEIFEPSVISHDNLIYKQRWSSKGVVKVCHVESVE